MKNNRVFISFAAEDSNLRDLLKGQARNESSPFEYVDMSIKEQLPQNEWKERCRTKIKGCDGLIVMLTPNSRNASGIIFELTCAIQERVPIVGLYSTSNKNSYYLYKPMENMRCIEWNWPNIANWLGSL